MNSRPPFRSVLSTTFRMGTLQIPVRLYKAHDRIGLSGQLFHDGCGGKIRQYKTCEDHPDLPYPATISGVVVGDSVIQIGSELKRDLLMGDCEMDAVCTFPITNFASLVADGIVVPFSCYQIAAQDHFEDLFSTLLDRLRINRSFLLVRYPDGDMRRFGIIFSTGVFMSVLYEEEVRERKFELRPPRPEFKRDLDKIISKYKVSEFPSLTAGDILQRVENWYSRIVVNINKRRAKAQKREKVPT